MGSKTGRKSKVSKFQEKNSNIKVTVEEEVDFSFTVEEKIIVRDAYLHDVYTYLRALTLHRDGVGTASHN